MNEDYEIGRAGLDDTHWITEELTNSWGSPLIVVNGEIIDASKQQALVARPQLGLLVFRDHSDNGVEIVAIEALVSGRGIGRALLDRLRNDSERLGKVYISVTTTNDNLIALRFYQRYGFALYELRTGAVDRARKTLKPEIPEEGSEGIRIRDEIELRYGL